MSGIYRFIPNDDACDICESMAGIYDFEPDVPVHPNCGCGVESVDVDALDGSCITELRNIQCMESAGSFSEIIELPSLDVILADDANIEVPVYPEDYYEASESWDDEEVKDASDWEEPPQTFDIDVPVVAGTRGDIEVEVGFEITTMICTAERWAICRDASPSGEEVEYEYLLENVGGGASGVTEVEFLDAAYDLEEPESPSDSGGEFYYDDDEVPI